MRLFWSSLLLCAALQAQPAKDLIDNGMRRFIKGEIAESIKDFDQAAKADPEVAPHLWQRGIAYYYVGKFEEGRKQFEVHRTVNPDDVENSAWWYICMARLGRRDEARAKLLPVGSDERIPMMKVYDLYAGRATEQDVLAAIEAGNPGERDRRFRVFYGHLYLGLYAEANGEPAKARSHIQKALDTKVGGYMWEVARIHAGYLKKSR
jgi:lipoprotein NlpI